MELTSTHKRWLLKITEETHIRSSFVICGFYQSSGGSKSLKNTVCIPPAGFRLTMLKRRKMYSYSVYFNLYFIHYFLGFYFYLIIFIWSHMCFAGNYFTTSGRWKNRRRRNKVRHLHERHANINLCKITSRVHPTLDCLSLCSDCPLQCTEHFSFQSEWFLGTILTWPQPKWVHSFKNLTSLIKQFFGKISHTSSHVTAAKVSGGELNGVYHYLHFKIILVQLDPDVCYGPLEEPGGSQHQHQLQVSWKCSLKNKTACKLTAHLSAIPSLHSVIQSLHAHPPAGSSWDHMTETEQNITAAYYDKSDTVTGQLSFMTWHCCLRGNMHCINPAVCQFLFKKHMEWESLD